VLQRGDYWTKHHLAAHHPNITCIRRSSPLAKWWWIYASKKQHRNKRCELSIHTNVLRTYKGNNMVVNGHRHMSNTDTKAPLQGCVKTMNRSQQFLNYTGTQEPAVITYRASDMVLAIHSNASYVI
jgi:hypothetical protein